MENSLLNFDSGFSYFYPLEHKKKKTKKKELQRFACLDGCELDNLVEGAQASMQIGSSKVLEKPEELRWFIHRRYYSVNEVDQNKRLRSPPSFLPLHR